MLYNKEDKQEIKNLVLELNRVSRELKRDGYTQDQINQYSYYKELLNKIEMKKQVAAMVNNYMWNN